MTDLLDPLILYLNKTEIKIDLIEFEFQYNSHPEHPSLLAISDTLNFFNVGNGAFNVDKEEIEFLPENFIAKIKLKEGSSFCFVSKVNKKFQVLEKNSKKHFTISEEDLFMIWEEIVLLIDPINNNDDSKRNLQKSVSLVLLVLSYLGLISISFLVNPNLNYWNASFYVLPIVGLLLSIVSLKDLFAIKNIKYVNQFCSQGVSFDCNTIINSKKWRILKIVNFSDLSIIFFKTQVIGLLVLSSLGLENDFF